MARSTTRRAGGVRSVVADHGKPDVMHGAKASDCIACSSDAEVLAGLLGAIPSHDFAFGRFSIVAETCNCAHFPSLDVACIHVPAGISQKPTLDAPAPPPPSEPSSEEVAVALRALDANLAAVHAALPSRTALVVFTGHSDPRAMAALGARKAAFEQAVRLGIPPHDIVAEQRWTAADGRALEEEVERAKRGLLFLCVK
jgi:RNA exonuclease 1